MTNIVLLLAAVYDIADSMLAKTGSLLGYWHHFANNGKRIEVETDDNSIGIWCTKAQGVRTCADDQITIRAGLNQFVATVRRALRFRPR